MTGCERPDLAQRLYRSVRGELPEAEELEVQAHLRECTPCGSAYQELSGLLGTMRWPVSQRPVSEEAQPAPERRPSWFQRIRRFFSTRGGAKN